MQNKPDQCKYPDCFNCVYEDCIYDRIEKEDVAMQNKFDKDLEAVEPQVISRRKRQNIYNKSEKGKITREKYLKSAKGKETRTRYIKSDKGQETRRRYLNSEKGKEMLKRRQKKIIENGKNAEYCRRYYQKKKMEKLLLEAK